MDRHGKNLSEGTQAIDVLSYHYNGNQLIAVDDAITYDNGNDFIGNFVYVNDAPAWHNFDEGHVIYNSTGTYFAETYLKDHLGNIRVAFGGAVNAVNSTIRQVNAYYPFGMNIRGLSSNNRSIVAQRNEYQYNGKMYQDEMGLNWLDYGRRMYDPVLGCFHTLDRFAEKYLSNTPYNYGANNPILLIDINGDSVKYVNENTKNFINQFINPTRVNKRGKEVKNNLYNEELASIIQELDKSERVYEFTDQYSSENPLEGGAITTDGNKVSIGFNEPPIEYGSKSNALFEETYHALQVHRGTLNIQKTGNNFGFSGNFLEAEYVAKRFASNAPLTRLS